METLRLKPGDVVENKPGRKHRVTAIEDVRLIEVSTPELDDVVRVEDDYNRVKTARTGMRKIVVFGAGATGRGHVGLLAWQAGFDMVFVDTDEDWSTHPPAGGPLHGGSFTMAAAAGTCVVDRRRVSDARLSATPSRGRSSEADLVLTAVFDQNLPDVAITVALAASALPGSRAHCSR